MNWFIYIVECSDKSLYSGITTDLERRINEHNSSKGGAKYTRSRQPVKLVRSQQVEDRKIASKYEFLLKRLNKPSKLELIKSKKTIKQ